MSLPAGELFKRNAAEAAITATGVSATFDTKGVVYAALDINITAINAGNVTFTLQRQGADGEWYNGPATAALAAVGKSSLDIGPEATTATGLTHFVFTNLARIAYTLAGGANSVSWSASLMGRGI